MQKARCMIAVFLLCGTALVWAVENSGTAPTNNGGGELSAFEVSQLIEKDLFKNKELIYDASQFLTPQQKNMLFTQNQKTTTTPFVLNFLVGFGIGSYIQGDTLNGVLCTVGDLVIGACLIFETMIYASAKADYDVAQIYYSSDSSIVKNRKEDVDFYGKMTALTGICYLGFRIIECVNPFLYAKKFNRTLTEALGMYDVAFDFAPTFDADGNMQARLMCKLSL